MTRRVLAGVDGRHHKRCPSCGQRHVERRYTASDHRLSRIWGKVDASGDCWEWTGTKVRGGYGRAWNGEAMVSAHRLVWETLVGPIRFGLTLDHLCRNKGCVNPAHLEPVTVLENLLRADARRRSAIAIHKSSRMRRAPSVRPRGRLTEDDVQAVRRLIAAGITRSTIARAFGVSRSAIAYIRSGRTWSRLETA